MTVMEPTMGRLGEGQQRASIVGALADLLVAVGARP